MIKKLYAFGILQTVVKVYVTLELQTKKFLPDKILLSVYMLIKHIYIWFANQSPYLSLFSELYICFGLLPE